MIVLEVVHSIHKCYSLLYSTLLTLLYSYIHSNINSLSRLILDEAHQSITAVDYRPIFYNLKKLQQYPIQKIYLTATLSLRIVSAFL